MTTEQHLDAWLARHYDPLDDVTDIRAAMLALYDEDEAYWSSVGWWRVHDVVVDRDVTLAAASLVAMAEQGDYRAQASIASYISREPQNRTAFMQAVVGLVTKRNV